MLSLIIFILILGAIVAIHEFGHFSFAKLFSIYVYEYSIGMGKKIFGHKKEKGETEFCIRAFPIGGYVMIAGEDIEDNKIPHDRQMCNKNFIQRFLVLFAGPLFNFLFAFVILFISALIYGAISTKPYIGSLADNYPAQTSGLSEGDLLLELNGETVSSWDKGLIILAASNGETIEFKVEKESGEIATYNITPIKETDSDGNVSYKFGISTQYKKEYGFIASLKYGVTRTISLFSSMAETIKYLFKGSFGIDSLSGPIGIYSVVDSQKDAGLEAILYLVAYLSINVGLVNLLPIPAFDGGRIFFLILEKTLFPLISLITKKKITREMIVKLENIVNTIGFCLIILLMVYVTFNDILRLI